MQRKIVDTENHKKILEPAQVRLGVLRNVGQKDLRPFLIENVEKGSRLYTDEWPGYNGLEGLYEHETCNHSAREYAKDLDGDGINEVHCNTQEGIWSIFRHKMRAHRGVRKDRLHLYVKEFEYFFNMHLANSYDKVWQFLFDILSTTFSGG